MSHCLLFSHIRGVTKVLNFSIKNPLLSFAAMPLLALIEFQLDFAYSENKFIAYLHLENKNLSRSSVLSVHLKSGMLL